MLYIFYSLLGGPVSYCGKINSDLLMHDGRALAILSAETGLLLLVDDLVEALEQKESRPLPLALRSGCVAKVVVEDLGDVIRGIGHTWMIGQVYMMIWAGPGGRPPPPMRGV